MRLINGDHAGPQSQARAYRRPIRDQVSPRFHDVAFNHWKDTFPIIFIQGANQYTSEWKPETMAEA